MIMIMSCLLGVLCGFYMKICDIPLQDLVHPLDTLAVVMEATVLATLLTVSVNQTVSTLETVVTTSAVYAVRILSSSMKPGIAMHCHLINVWYCDQGSFIDRVSIEPL